FNSRVAALRKLGRVWVLIYVDPEDGLFGRELSSLAKPADVYRGIIRAAGSASHVLESLEQFVRVVRQRFQVLFGKGDRRKIPVGVCRNPRGVVFYFYLFSNHDLEFDVILISAFCGAHFDWFAELCKAFYIHGDGVGARLQVRKAIAAVVVSDRGLFISLAVVEHNRRGGNISHRLIDDGPTKLHRRLSIGLATLVVIV